MALNGSQEWKGPGYLVPSLNRVLPLLHKEALTDAGDAQVQPRAWPLGCVHLEVLHHLPVTRRLQRKERNEVYGWAKARVTLLALGSTQIKARFDLKETG